MKSIGRFENGQLVEHKTSNVVPEGWYEMPIVYYKYVLVNGQVVEGATQEEIDDRIELQEENELLRQTIEQLGRADDLAKEIFSFVRKHTGLTDNQKSTLKSLAMKLFSGDVEEALTEWSAINRPTQEGKMQKVYDKLKVKFDAL